MARKYFSNSGRKRNNQSRWTGSHPAHKAFRARRRKAYAAKRKAVGLAGLKRFLVKNPTF